MTDKPTDEALENLFVEETGFDIDDFPAAIFDFARAVLAKWGQPAQAQADSVPAVSDLPPLPAPDLRDVGTTPQEIKEFLKGYATEYARTAIAARAPAGAEESRTIPDREIPGIVEKALQELEGLVKYATSTYGHWNMRRAKGALSDLEWWARRKLAAHAQAADSVLEDAADPLQGAANWLAEAHGQFSPVVLSGCLMIGYNRAKRLHDAALTARKQGANHDR